MGKQQISIEQAEGELETILGFKAIDTCAFQRAHFCMRVLGCPVSNTGKFAVIEDQDGKDARLQWDAFQDDRDHLADLYEQWKDMQDDE